jgi:hypothetical protein
MKFFLCRNSAVRTIREAKSNIQLSFVIRYSLFEVLLFKDTITASVWLFPNELEKLFLGEQLDPQFVGLC